MEYIIEVWVDIYDYEGLYQVSNYGRVKSLKYGKERILSAFTNTQKYLIVDLSKDGVRKHFRVHRLVAQHFIPNPNNLPDVNHINEDKNDNRACNLEWCTKAYNNAYGSRKTNLSKRVLQIDKESNEVLNEFISTRHASRMLGCHSGGISACCLGKGKTYKGYKWRYKDAS